jgi:hypothetical protein
MNEKSGMKRQTSEQRKCTLVDPWDYYSQRNFSIFPAKKDKRPVVKWKGYQTRHPTAAEITEWKKSKHNIAIATGELSDLMVIDADSLEAVQELEALNPDGVKIPTVYSPRSGRRHFYVRYRRTLPMNLQGCGKSKKIDLKTEGGYVLAPPGKTKDGEYRWDERLNLDTVPIPIIPKRWEYLLLHARLSSRVRKEIEPSPRLVRGRRDNDIFHMACVMRREGYSREKVERMAVMMARECEPPFGEQDAMRKVESAWNYDTPPVTDREASLFFPLSAVTPRAIEWLWNNRIPYGCYSAVGGDPGDGKSIALTDICAKITRGRSLPDNRGTDPSGSVIYMVAEDNMSDTVRIRAQDAGANLDKFIVSTGEKPGGGFFSILNLEDITAFEEQIVALRDRRLVVFDPITTFLAGLHTHDETAVRAALAPLNRIAERHKIAIIGVGHLNKDEAKCALYRLSGSIAFVAVARTVWLVKHDKDEGAGRRFFSPLKHNILKDPTTLSFKITGPLGRPVVEWDDNPVDVECVDLLGNEDMRERRTALFGARTFLDDFLPSGEEKLQTEIMTEALGQGHKKRTMERAKNQLRITSIQRERQWYWRRA